MGPALKPLPRRCGGAIAVLLLLAVAVAPTSAADSPHHGHDANASAAAAVGKKQLPGGTTSLDVAVDGPRLHLLTVARDGDAGAAGAGGAPVIAYQRSDDGGATFSAPVRVGDRQAAPIAKRGMDAQIAAAGDTLLAVWPTAGGDKMGRGPMAAAVSRDGGKTWSAAPDPADDHLDIGHSFIDLAADAATGAFHVVWLDSREGADKGLRYARSTDGGATWSKNATLDPATCECCWNTIALDAGGAVSVLYRDANPRDMALVRSRDGGATWSPPVRVGAFDWDINACPHVGGALAADGRHGYAAVWTARDAATHGVYVLATHDGGSTWSAAATRVGPDGASRPDLALAADGRLVVAYDASVDGRRGIYVETSRDGGRTWSPPSRLSDPAAAATHARLARTPAGVRAFWTEQRPSRPATWTSVAIP